MQEELVNPRKLFVGNLFYEVTDAQLLALFQSYGEVVEAIVIHDHQTGKSRGFGFVKFAREEDAKKAMASLDATDFKGRILRIVLAKQTRPSSFSNKTY